MLWVKGVKAGKAARTPPPTWLDAIFLARRLEMPLAQVLELEPVWGELAELIPIREQLGIPVKELLALSPVWVERLKEVCYHLHKQQLRI